MKTVNDIEEIGRIQSESTKLLSALLQLKIRQKTIVNHYKSLADEITIKLIRSMNVTRNFNLYEYYNLPKINNQEVILALVLDQLVEGNIDLEAYCIKDIEEAFIVDLMNRIEQTQ
ncbi:hypothetical protein [Thalassomonas sp. M1454]|uniref:hypothetical protein n=1 Tax=Thalassomonas sp. M1454 TaxID=2594477 RepID=UPI00117CE387|nr:hypothetical protein [Thalassomonas sp. M1454]TRX57970.1 hypothetical protein FNN08_00865 [Thalassomonas sp. M1454]